MKSKTKLEPISNLNISQDQFIGQKAKRPSGYQLASMKETQDYRDSQSYTHKTTFNSQLGNEVLYQPYECCVDTEQLKKYGLGVYLFLEFVKRVGVTLLIMSAINAIPLSYAYSQGKGLQTYTESYMISLAKTSLGNIIDGDQKMYLVFTMCDMLSMIVFFSFYLHWRSFHNEAVVSEQKDITVLKPPSYALSVVGFDESTQSLEKQLKKYFLEVFGKTSIYEVEVVYNYSGNFKKFIQYDELIEKHEKESQIIAQTGKQGSDLEQIKKQLQSFEQEMSNVSQVFQPTYAIIHFRTLRDKFNFINFCRRHSLIDNFSNNLTRTICCARLPPKSQLFLGTTALTIKSNNLSRPEQINWANHDISGCSKILRGILSIVLLIIAIVITSSCIALCTLYVSSTSACANYNPNTTLTDAQAAGGQTLYCHCSANFIKIFSDPFYKAACGKLQQTILYSNIMQVGASLVSSISNVLLIVVVSLIARFILKSDSKPKEYSFIFVAVLISNYINSSILPLIMNGNIFGFQCLEYLKFIDFIDFKNVAIFKDYDTDWYAVVGPYYINFMIIAIIGPIISLFTHALSSCLTHMKVKSACENVNKDPIIQKQANVMITGQMFEIPTEQALVCLYFSITIMYSSLLPILLPIATIVMLTTFICKKAIILRFSVRVPADEALSEKTLTIIPFVILVHFLMGVWSHTAKGVFSQSSYIVQFSQTWLGDKFDRVFLDIIMLGGVVFALVWILFDYTILTFFNFIKECCFKNDLEIPLENVSQQSAKYEDRLQRTNILGSYKLVNNPVYGHAIMAFKQLKNRLKKQSQLLKSQRKGVMGSTIQLNPIVIKKGRLDSSVIVDELNPQNSIMMRNQ